MCKVRLLQRFLSQNWQCAVCSVSCVWYLVHRCAVCVQCLMCTDVQCVLCEVHRCAARHTLVLVASCITLSCALKHLLYKSVFVSVFVSVYVYFYLYPRVPVNEVPWNILHWDLCVRPFVKPQFLVPKYCTDPSVFTFAPLPSFSLFWRWQEKSNHQNMCSWHFNEKWKKRGICPFMLYEQILQQGKA